VFNSQIDSQLWKSYHSEPGKLSDRYIKISARQDLRCYELKKQKTMTQRRMLKTIKNKQN
jgi:hypothetical protein